MNIYTSQEAALVNCRGCPRPSCDAPQQDCESITVEACGYSLPTHPDVPAADRCKIFKKLTHTLSDSGGYPAYSVTAFQTTTITGSYLESRTCIFEGKFLEADGVRSCVTGQTSSSYSTSDIYTETFDGTGEVFQTFSRVGTSGSTGEGPCTGTVTTTQQYPPSEPSSSTEDLIVCDCPPVEVDESYTYTSPGSFSKTLTDEAVEDVRAAILHVYTALYEDEVTIEDLAEEITARIALLGEEDSWGGTACSSSVATSVTHADPPDPEADPLPETEIVCTQPSAATKARYKIGIPNTDSYANYDAAHAAWIIAHAAWLGADPDERGEEPLDPVQRSVFECQWDEVFFPEEWEAWKILHDAYLTAAAAYEAWVAAGSEGDAPPVPADPGTAPTPAPSLVISRSWSYDGSNEFSEWFEIAIPDNPGETRVVNMMVKCYHSTRLGVKPTAHGEIFVL